MMLLGRLTGLVGRDLPAYRHCSSWAVSAARSLRFTAARLQRCLGHMSSPYQEQAMPLLAAVSRRATIRLAMRHHRSRLVTRREGAGHLVVAEWSADPTRLSSARRCPTAVHNFTTSKSDKRGVCILVSGIFNHSVGSSTHRGGDRLATAWICASFMRTVQDHYSRFARASTTIPRSTLSICIRDTVQAMVSKCGSCRMRSSHTSILT